MKMKSVNTIKMYNVLISFLWEHRGKENAVSAHDIANFLTASNFSVRTKTVNSIVRKLLYEYHIPICSLNANGYFWAITKEDINACIKHLQSRIDMLQEHIDTLKYFIID